MSLGRSKPEIAARLPIRRGISEAEAALYVGIGVSKFQEMVRDHRMPRPYLIDRRKVWDFDDLDAAFKSLPREGDDAPSDSWADFRDGGNTAAAR